LVEIENYDYSDDFVKKILYDKMKEELLRTKVTSVFIDEELGNENISEIIKL
jgi:hypothetical protein